MNAQGIEFLNHDQAREDAFVTRSRRKKMHKDLSAQLEVAYKRRFQSTKVPLDLLREMLAAIAVD